MDYADILAATYVAAKQAADLGASRSEFESSANRERVLRDYVDRMSTLSKEREAAEPQGAGDYFGEFTRKTLSPIPDSLPEGAAKGIGAGVGYALGSTLGENMTGATPEVISGVMGKLPSKGQDFTQHLKRRLVERGIPANKASAILGALKKLSPEASSWELKGLRSLDEGAPLAKALEPGSRSVVRSELLNLAKQLGDKFEIPKRWSIGGGIAGAVAGSAVAGLPFAIKSIYDKMRGGSGALSARAKADEAKAEAVALSKQRERILAGLETASTASEG